MKTLIKTNENGKITKSFYTNEQSAKDAANSFLKDCTVHAVEREKRTAEIVDFEFEKYGFDSMPIFANFEKNNLGLFVKAVFQSGISNRRIRVTNQVQSL
jgi:hypothetical protein